MISKASQISNGVKILIATSSFNAQEALDKLKERGFEVVLNPYGRKLTTQELQEFLPGVVGLIAGTEKIDRETMKNSQLKVISRVGVGIDNIDLKAAEESGIVVKNTPSAPTAAVAELTVGALLGLLRSVPSINQDLHNKIWSKKTGIQLLGKTVAIIGFGRIGRYVAKLLKPFGARLLAVDLVLSGMVDEVPVVSLAEAIKQADIISLHLSGSDQVLGKQEFSMMKKGVFILNAARGGVIDEAALTEALKEGKVAGCWLDVFSQEPYEGVITEFPQAILTSHIGSNTEESRQRMETEAIDNLISVLNDKYSSQY